LTNPLSRLFMTGQQRLLAGGFLLLVLLLGALQFSSTQAGRPYEGWDEIATYNGAFVTSGPVGDRIYRYGPLDTFMQWIALDRYQKYDAIGSRYPHIRYGNHAPSSWNDPAAAVGEKTWDGADYNYFRGTDDREPMFGSRRIHFLFAYALLAGLGLAVVASVGTGAAVLVLTPLLLLVAAPEMYFQASQSLPNAINTLLFFGIVYFAMAYALRQRRCDLTLSLALLALGVNFKPDIIIAIGSPGLALILVTLRQGLRAALRDVMPGVILGAAIFLATDPGLWRDPLMNLRVRYHALMGAAGGGSGDTGYIAENWINFRNFLDSVFLRRGLGGIVAPSLVALGLAGALGAAIWKRTDAAIALAIGAVTACVAWGVIVLKAPGASDRYFLNGLAAFLAATSVGLLVLSQTRARLAQMLAALLALVWLSQIVPQISGNFALARDAAGADGFAPAHHRTLASLEAVRLATASGFRGKVLVDQHSYIDLRPFRLRGVDAQYVNMDSLPSVMAAIDRSQDHLVVFVKGTDSITANSWRPWMGDWPAKIRERYRAYQAQFAALPVVKHYPGLPHEVLSTAPIEPRADTFVSILRRHP